MEMNHLITNILQYDRISFIAIVLRCVSHRQTLRESAPIIVNLIIHKLQ